MIGLSETTSDIMRKIADSLRTPVVILLLLIIAIAIILVGTLIAEALTERRKLRANMPRLVDELREPGADISKCVEDAQLIGSQKKALIELTLHPSLTDDMRDALAARLLEEESGKFERRVMLSDLLSKLGPMLGLMGTLIPLGPGLIALGQGDTFTLSQSLLMAFDTTILGLISAAVCMVVSAIRKRWYKNYMSVLETLTECVLEAEAETESYSQ